MTDFHYPASVDALQTAATDEARRFYVVSPSKFAILYLATFSLYGVYWFYRNWDHYNKHCPDARPAGRGVWPLPRALFSVFFTHDLFAKIKYYSCENAEVSAWSDRSHATLLVALTIVANVLSRASVQSVGSPVLDILSLLILLPLCSVFLKAQAKINLSCGDPAGRGNDAFSAANTAWTVLGGLSWCMTLSGLFLSGR